MLKCSQMILLERRQPVCGLILDPLAGGHRGVYRAWKHATTALVSVWFAVGAAAAMLASFFTSVAGHGRRRCSRWYRRLRSAIMVPTLDSVAGKTHKPPVTNGSPLTIGKQGVVLVDIEPGHAGPCPRGWSGLAGPRRGRASRRARRMHGRSRCGRRRSLLVAPGDRRQRPQFKSQRKTKRKGEPCHDAVSLCHPAYHHSGGFGALHRYRAPVQRLCHRVARCLQGYLGRGPAHPHTLCRAHLPQGLAEGGSRRLPPAARHHPRQRHHDDRHRRLSSRCSTPSCTPTA